MICTHHQRQMRISLILMALEYRRQGRPAVARAVARRAKKLRLPGSSQRGQPR